MSRYNMLPYLGGLESVYRAFILISELSQNGTYEERKNAQLVTAVYSHKLCCWLSLLWVCRNLLISKWCECVLFRHLGPYCSNIYCFIGYFDCCDSFGFQRIQKTTYQGSKRKHRILWQRVIYFIFSVSSIQFKFSELFSHF